MKKGELLMKENILPRGWKLSFELNPVGEVGGFSSIIHATINGNIGAAGERIPAVWFISNTRKMHITSDIGGNTNYVYNTNFNLPRDRFSTIVIQQIQKADLTYHYQIIINGKLIHSVLNHKPKIFQNVKYYVGDPWFTPAKTELRNIKLHKHAHKCKYIFL
ncbi:MAG: hypothetical protein AAFY76_22565 [Cyanobacteria bacterium J06649_11]